MLFQNQACSSCSILWILLTLCEYQGSLGLSILAVNECVYLLRLRMTIACIEEIPETPYGYIPVASKAPDTSICEKCGGIPITNHTTSELTSLEKCTIEKQENVSSDSSWNNEGFTHRPVEDPKNLYSLCEYEADIVKPGAVNRSEYCIHLFGAQCGTLIPTNALLYNTTCFPPANANFSLRLGRCADMRETTPSTEKYLTTQTTLPAEEATTNSRETTTVTIAQTAGSTTQTTTDEREMTTIAQTTPEVESDTVSSTKTALSTKAVIVSTTPTIFHEYAKTTISETTAVKVIDTTTSKPSILTSEEATQTKSNEQLPTTIAETTGLGTTITVTSQQTSSTVRPITVWTGSTELGVTTGFSSSPPMHETTTRVLYTYLTHLEGSIWKNLTINDTGGLFNSTVILPGATLLGITFPNSSETYLLQVGQLPVPYDVFDSILNNSEQFVDRLQGSSQSQIQEVYLIPTNTPLISITLYYENGTEAPAAVVYALDVSNDTAMLDKFGPDLCGDDGPSDSTIILQSSYECAYVNQQTGQFSSQGCTTTRETGSEVTCDCSHTTIFAVLLSVTVVVQPRGVKICSYVVESLSVVFLGITICILLRLRKKIRGDRTMVQINLATSLLLLHITSLFHDRVISTNALCEMNAVFTHLFLLSSAMWMLLEGVTLLTKTMDSALRFSENKQKMMTLIRLSAGWLLPLVITIISFAVGQTTDSYLSPGHLYQRGQTSGNTEVTCGERNSSSASSEAVSIPKYDVCWVSNAHFMRQGAVFIPLGIIFGLNIAICARVGFFVYKMTVKAQNFRPTQDRQDDKEHVKAALKAVLLLFPVLGVPWVIGYFTGIADQGASIIFMYVNVVINGLQGCFLFILYCVVSTEVRTAFRNSLARGKVNIGNYIDMSKAKMSVFSTNTNVRLQGVGEMNSAAVTEFESKEL